MAPTDRLGGGTRRAARAAKRRASAPPDDAAAAEEVSSEPKRRRGRARKQVRLLDRPESKPVCFMIHRTTCSG